MKGIDGHRWRMKHPSQLLRAHGMYEDNFHGYKRPRARNSDINKKIPRMKLCVNLDFRIHRTAKK